MWRKLFTVCTLRSPQTGKLEANEEGVCSGSETTGQKDRQVAKVCLLTEQWESEAVRMERRLQGKPRK